MRRCNFVKCEMEDCTYETSIKRNLIRHMEKIHKAKEENVEKQEVKEKGDPQTEQNRLKCSNVQDINGLKFKGCIRISKTTKEP